jgi:hypothetical protein
MTNLRLLLVLITLLILGAVAYSLLMDVSLLPETGVQKVLVKEVIVTPDPVQRTIIGLPVGVKKKIADIEVKNPVSEDWEEKLVEALKNQGGESVEKIEIKKVASLVWVQNDVGINVESVIVTIKGKDKKESLFKALVDSQTGKILETWDRPIQDPSNPKKGFRLKVDPRYFNQ